MLNCQLSIVFFGILRIVEDMSVVEACLLAIAATRAK
jgi:hypothetical protein|tara:strand:- start:347 stop:457 length:111 start_codon:yes stop_codon:yes gene_type:complete